MNESVVGANEISQELEIATKPVQPSQPISGPVEPCQSVSVPCQTSQCSQHQKPVLPMLAPIDSSQPNLGPDGPPAWHSIFELDESTKPRPAPAELSQSMSVPEEPSEQTPTLGPQYQWLEPPGTYEPLRRYKIEHHVLAFGFYDTLVNIAPIYDNLTAQFPTGVFEIFLRWKHHQLEYMYRSNLMGKHISFKEIKRRALHHALIESGVDELTHTKAVRDNIVDQGPLPFHDDVLPGVVQLANLPNIRIKILTNGDEESVRTVCDAEPNLKELQREGQLEWKDIIISSTSVGKFKPAKEMYQALLSAAGTGVSSKQVWLISTNPVDLAGAIEMGMSTAWVNASGYDWPDHLSADENGKSTRKPDINVKTFELLHDELRKCGVGNPTRV